MAKSSQELKGLVENEVKSNGWPRPSAFDRIKNLIIITSVQNIIISGTLSRSSDVDGIKIFDKDYQATKRSGQHLRPGHLYQKF